MLVGNSDLMVPERLLWTQKGSSGLTETLKTLHKNHITTVISKSVAPQLIVDR